MSNQRNAVFDIAKCIAMYLVVFGHLIADRTGDSAYLINMVHLPVLFFISGFFTVSSVEKRSAGELLKKKAVTLLVPYLIWSGISLAANMALTVLKGGFSIGVMLSEAMQIFVYARSVWFLIQLFVTFAIFIGVYKLLIRCNMRKYLLIVFASAWIVLSLFIPGDILDFGKFKWLFPFFLAGYLVGCNKDNLTKWIQSNKLISRLSWISLIYPLLVVLLVREDAYRQYTSFRYHSFSGVAFGFAYYGVSALGVIFVMLISRLLRHTGLGKIAAQIGTYSMDIYVIHMFLIKFIPIPVDMNATDPWLVWLLLGVISLGIVLVIWLLSKFVLRKIKLFRISVGMK